MGNWLFLAIPNVQALYRKQLASFDIIGLFYFQIKSCRGMAIHPYKT